MSRAYGEKIKKLREKKGWSQEGLADKAGLVINTIGKAEKSGEMAQFTLNCIAESLGVALTEILLPEPKVWIGDLPTPLPSDGFFGREEELKTLDNAWAEKTCRVVTVVGGWGTGKSTLINEWLKGMKTTSYGDAQWVFGWSFRGQGNEESGSGDNFFHFVLSCLGDPHPDTGNELDKALRLRDRIGNHRTLFILDGLEPLQTPPTVSEMGGRIREENDALRRLIRHFATQINGLCVITSRFPILDLKDQMSEGKDNPVWEIDLRPLDLKAAVKLLRSRKLLGPDEEFANAAKAYHCNPLTLNFLATVLERRYQRKIASWSNVTGRENTIDALLATLERFLSEDEKAVMKLMGLFEGPATGQAIDALRMRPPIPGLTQVLMGLDEDVWSALLIVLRELHLLAERKKERPHDLECHPVVRAYFAKKLSQDEPEAWQKGHLRLFEHFKSAEILGIIDNVYEAIHHGCKAGHHAEVFEKLVWEGMSAGFALRRLNGHGSGARDERVVKSFVPDPFDPNPQCPIAEIDGERKARLFLWIAVVQHVLGRVSVAITFAQAAREQFKNARDGQGNLGLWCSTAYLGWSHAAGGDLKEALNLSDECIQGVKRDLDNEPLWRKIAYCLKACMISFKGDFEDALNLYKEVMNEHCAMPKGFEVTVAIFRFHYACLLLKLNSQKEAAMEAQKLISVREDYPTLGFLGYQVLARMELANALEKPRNKAKALANAETHLLRAKDYLNLGPAHDQIIVNALFMAQFNRISGNLKEADSHLKQAEEAVGPFALHDIDCLLERGLLCVAQDDKERAMEKWQDACRLVEKHGYHCVDSELRDLREALKKP